MLRVLLNFIVKTPIYPHWLDFRNKERGNNELIKYFRGRVLETGAGNCEKKEIILKKNRRISEYLATDFSSWHEQFEIQKKEAGRLGVITEILYGRIKDDSRLDLACDALDLPFENSSFDTYASFEVTEHIPDLQKFFSEASRVLKKGGRCITVSPFIYREHGGIDSDFQRITRGGYRELARKSGLTVEKIYTYSFFGTTLSILVNQFVVRKILEGKGVVRILLFFLSPFIFLFSNCLGYVIDSLDQDDRFASCYHVVMKKI
ncbi:MAG: class I SAM-dependent methyltransferase [Patescibacteria group bacterium]